METFVKVCSIEEIPPGKGRLFRVGGREVLLYDREGRIGATLAEPAVRRAVPFGEAPPGERPAGCHSAGMPFQTEQEDSPAQAQSHGAALRVKVERGAVYVAIEEAPGDVQAFA